MNATHTATPWAYDGKFTVTIPAQDGDYHFRVEKADASFIVKACNAHDDLVSALMKIADSDERPGHVAYISKAEVARIARAALAKAGAA